MIMRRAFVGSVAFMNLAPPGLVHAGSSTNPQAAVGRPAPAFETIDSSKRVRSLAEFEGKLVVLEWTSPSCPFAKAQYVSGRMPELQKWAEQHGVIWLTMLSSHPSRSDYLEPEKAEAFNRGRGGVPSALLIDASGAVGAAYGAKTANHMFIVGKNGILAYAGGIDDGETMDPRKVLAAHSYVRSALEDVLNGKPARVATTRPFGCALAYAG
jgi:peroxiredoxin